MKIIIEMEIESEDYGGKEFKEEIEKLIEDIDSNSKLIKFKMREKFGDWNSEKDFNWQLIARKNM